MLVYIDEEYKCHINSANGLREIEAPEFDGYCAEYIEGMRLIPEGEIWKREDGEEFQGRMKTPWKDYTRLEKAQLEYELAQLKAALTDAEDGLRTLGAEWEESNG